MFAETGLLAGADGLLLVGEGTHGTSNARMRVINSMVVKQACAGTACVRPVIYLKKPRKIIYS